MKTKPIHEVRLGTIKAAVWKNETETGARYNVTFGRIYKDGDSWRTSDSFSRDDLLVVEKVAGRTFAWIHQQEQEDAAAKAPPAVKTETPLAEE